MPEVTRFAPSPTGLLHLGHAYSALFAREQAGAGGRFILRIEDIDRGRCRPEFEAAIFDDLAWLGLDWEEPVRRQSDHFDDYAAALQNLAAMGVTYPCFCTRKDIAEEIARAVSAPHGPIHPGQMRHGPRPPGRMPPGRMPSAADIPTGVDGPIYPGTCRALPAAERAARIANGDPHAIRLDAAGAAQITGPLTWHDREAGEQAADVSAHGDVVLARKDTPTSYHLSVTVDDAMQGVTLVTRGADLFEATHVHRLLQALLGLPAPGYHHHRLLTDPGGRRFAKRDRSLTLAALGEAGHPAETVRAMARGEEALPAA